MAASSQRDVLQNFLQTLLTRYSSPKQPHTMEFCKRLLEDLEKLLADAEDYDVVLQIGEEPDVREFRAHSAILRARCSYFRRGLSKEWACRQEDNVIVFRKTNISPKVFSIILNYLYGGKVTLQDTSEEDIFNLLLAADELALDEIFDYLQRYLIDHKLDWVHQNFILVNRTAFEHHDFKELQSYCTRVFALNPEVILQAEDLYALEEEILYDLLDHSEIGMDEYEIWTRVLDWSITQSTLSSDDPNEWTRVDCRTLEIKLTPFFPKIRFYHMSASEFHTYVVPYRNVLPDYLYKDLLRYFLVPGSIPTYNSTKRVRRGATESRLTDSKHIAMIASWMDRRDAKGIGWVPYGCAENPYEFQLLARGSRDGFSCQEIVSRCQQKGDTIILFKLKRFNQLIGGYNPLGWDNCVDTWGYSTQSFIFSITDPGDEAEKATVSWVNDPKSAMRTNGKDTLQFGAGDLVFMYSYDNTGMITCRRNSYDQVLLPSIGPCKVRDYEVFQVVRRAVNHDE